MLTASQWNKLRRTEHSVAVLSTNKGQTWVNGTVRKVVAVRVLPATRSNPHGLGTKLVKTEAHGNPLIDAEAANALYKDQDLGDTNLNLIKRGSGIRCNHGRRGNTYTQYNRWVPFRDCVKHVLPVVVE